MVSDSDRSHKYHLGVNCKRYLFILLLFNSFLACIYYVHEQNPSFTEQNVKIYANQHYSSSNGNKMSRTIDTSIEFIRDILENEYNHDDLKLFYNMVEKEFRAGLRCTRKPNQSQTTTVNEQTNSNLTEIRSSSTTKIPSQANQSRLFPSRHRERRTLYSFLITNAELCSTESVDLLIIVISKSENYKTRDAIRRTWGSGKGLGNYSSISIKLLFLVDFDEKLSSNIRLENNLFHDIIQVELPQHYTLVTHRVLSLFEWSFRYCRTAKFLFKADDDIFINLILLLKFISPLTEISTNSSFRISDMTIYGYKHYNPRVFRQSNNVVETRYVVTTDEFPCSNYPDFLSGFGYLIPKKSRDALVYASYQDFDIPFRISDVYVTGILPDYLSLPRQPMSDYKIRFVGDCEGFFNHSTAFSCAVGLHHGDTSDVFTKYNRYWQHVRTFL